MTPEPDTTPDAALPFYLNDPLRGFPRTEPAPAPPEDEGARLVAEMRTAVALLWNEGERYSRVAVATDLKKWADRVAALLAQKDAEIGRLDAHYRKIFCILNERIDSLRAELAQERAARADERLAMIRDVDEAKAEVSRLRAVCERVRDENHMWAREGEWPEGCEGFGATELSFRWRDMIDAALRDAGKGSGT